MDEAADGPISRLGARRPAVEGLEVAGTPRTMEGFGALSAADCGQERDQMQRQLKPARAEGLRGLPACLRDWILHPSDHEVGEFSCGAPAPPTAMRFAALVLGFLGIVGSDSPPRTTPTSSASDRTP